MNTTRLTTVKNEAALPTSLRELVYFQVVDDKIEAVVVKIGEEFIRIVKADAYGVSLKVLTEQPKKEVEKWAVVGMFKGLVQVDELFDTKAAADERLEQYLSAVSWTESGVEVVSRIVLVDSDVL